jgi:alpha-amylase/alpha-mannosidase (GH57 family)
LRKLGLSPIFYRLFNLNRKHLAAKPNFENMSKKYICIHGHFYQPPRENPWLNKVELQESAYPYHDWNHRINAECYVRNSASRILDEDGRIEAIMNNYAWMSFNIGPTLLAWMENETPETYKAILQADKDSMELFSGHGSALAQAYNHLIMPLANERDQETQVIWGIEDFRSRYKRDPEGMWLGETAVNTSTLEMLAKHGIKFTILSPYQAKRVRKIGTKDWKDATHAKVDSKKAYKCKLPSGNEIALFFYDGPASQGVAFEGLLNNGVRFAERLQGLFSDNHDLELAHIATDGESYGHHHKLGEMALSYCLDHLEKQEGINLTVYGEFLEKFPPEYEAEIIENTSWSCYHGV